MGYAAVVSAMEKIERLPHPSQSTIHLPSLEIQSIYEALCSLESLIQICIKMRSLINYSNSRFDSLKRAILHAALKIVALSDVHVDFLSKLETLGVTSGSADTMYRQYCSILSQPLLALRLKITSLSDTQMSDIHELGYNIVADEENPASYFAANDDIVIAHSFVISAKQKLQRLHHSSQSILLFPNSETKSFYEELHSLESVLRELGEMKGSTLRLHPLEQQVEHVADQIEEHMDNDCNSPLVFSKEIKQEIRSLTGKLKKYKEEYYDNLEEEQRRDTVDYAVPSRRIGGLGGGRKLGGLDDNEVQKLVDRVRIKESFDLQIMPVMGSDDEVTKLLEWVHNESTILQILLVVGNGIIDTTALVRQVYEHSSVQGRFQQCLWLTLGPNCKLQDLTVVVSDDGACYISKRHEEMGNPLGINLDPMYHLFFRDKYFMVLDDVCSTQMWNDFKPYLTNYDNRSRVILTTGLSNVVNDIGKKITKNCKGIPTAIPAVGKEPHMVGKTVDDAVSFPSRIFDFGKESELVALDNEVMELMKWIFNGSIRLETMSVVGMVGIGKTTLVQQIYDHPIVKDYFDCCFWVTIGPNYKWQEFIGRVFDNRCFQIHEQPTHLGYDEFGEYLHNFLCGKKFLIVLDDVWSIQVLKDLARFLPKAGNGRRIILTTRLSYVTHAMPPVIWAGGVYEKHFLSSEDSWTLLQKTVFVTPKEHCSYKLQKYGKKIAKNCEGLPLAILAVGKHLRVAEKTVEYWKKVSKQENLHDIIKGDYQNILETLTLSYKMLPRRLKECFLYIGIIPNYEISAAALIKLWIAEGFLRSQLFKNKEDIAEECLRELVSQSVVLVAKQSSQIGRIKICRVHFVFRYLCVTEAENEKFCCVIKKYAGTFSEGTNVQQRLSIHNNVLLGIKQSHDNIESILGVRSLLCLGPPHQHLLWWHLSFKLLKVLNALSIRFYKFPHQVLKLVRLKYLAITYDGKIPEFISQLWNLEVLIVGRHQCIISPEAPACLPAEIWNLKWLKHLQCMGIDLPTPCIGTNGLEHLITLSGVSARSCTQAVLARLPKLKKIGIRIELAPDKVQTFRFLSDVTQQLCNLQSFKCDVLGLSSRQFIERFPKSLTKLTLSGCRVPWHWINSVQELSNLETLKLRCNAFCGPKWVTGGREFCKLRVLLLEDLDIEEWETPRLASSLCFPRLERLVIRHCYKLHEIPWEIRYYCYELKMIELDDCSPSLVHESRSAIQVSVNCSWDDEKSES